MQLTTGSEPRTRALHEAESTPLHELDVSRTDRFQSNTHWPFFARLRRDEPVHYCADSPYGPYWSITRFDDIVEIDRNHRQFSSEGNVIIGDVPESFNSRAFIVADPPVHTRERRAVLPALCPRRVAAIEEDVRVRIVALLDDLPRGETFDWAERASVELTTQMVAALFDFPWDERHLLPWWSDVTMSTPRVAADAMSRKARQAIIDEYTARLQALWRERAGKPRGDDLITALACHPHTAAMVDEPAHLVGTVTLLIGANDTSRTAMSGAVVAFHEFPAEWEKLRSRPGLVRQAASEIVRWQTPLAHMRRTATEDLEFRGSSIRKGDRVVMWYCSGNRDEQYFDDADTLRIERPRVRGHLAYGMGIHRCVGRHVAEMQLRVLLEEMIRRFERVELVAEPRRTASNFFTGYDEVLVRIAPE